MYVDVSLVLKSHSIVHIEIFCQIQQPLVQFINDYKIKFDNSWVQPTSLSQHLEFIL